ncbi:MAG: restriction endonuclease subunit S [Anaerolineaceae bacterium]
MSRLEDLIQTLCPDGVEYKKLGDMGAFFGGLTGKTKQDFQDGNKKFISYMNVYKNPAVDTTTEDFVRIGAKERQNAIEYGDILFTGSSETPEECGISSVMIKHPDEPFYLNSFTIGFRLHDTSTYIPEFSKYLFRSAEMRKQINKTANGVTRFNVSKRKLAAVKVPLPPLPVQEEIVRILDTFTALETELENQLEAELAARTKQYEHYREELLGLEVSNVLKSEQIDTTKRGRNNKSTDSVLMRIDELCHIQRGRVMSKDYLRDNAGIFPVYSSQTENQGVFGYINSFDFDFESLTWTTDGANAGSIFYHNQEKFSITNVCGLLRVKSPKINTKFLYYALQNTAKEYVNYGMGNPKLMSNVMGRVKIIVPPLAVQEKIVSILDRFDALVNDLKSGLPAEIALRRKQYEYYRDKLLTFTRRA